MTIAGVASVRFRTVVLVMAFFGTWILHLALNPAQGLTDDDDFYAPAGVRYAAWLGAALTDPPRAWNRSAIDAAFTANHEHPPLAKFVFGVTHAVFHDALGIFGSLDGARAGTALFAALMTTLLAGIGFYVGGHAWWVAPLLLLSLPRLFFHSEVATLDVPVAAMVVAVTASFLWAEHRGIRAAVLCGVVFGLALLTKLNAPFAVLPCLLYVLLSRWRGFFVDGASLTLPRVPPALWAMALLGPVLFVALWPWLWFDTFQRIGAYVAFHLHHYAIYLFYDGEIWDEPFAPWHASWVLGFGTLPAPVLVTGLLGAGSAVFSLRRLVRSADAEGRCAGATSADRILGLSLLQAVFAISIVSFLNVPKYGGEKLFMPFFPFFCLLAARGVTMVADALFALVPAIVPALTARGRAVVVVAVALSAAVPGFVGSARYHGGFALSYYGELVGGLRGAVARGFERTYYDVADKELARFLDDHARGRRVHFEPNHKEYVRTYRWLHRDGVIKQVTLTDKLDAADIVVLTHERRWSTYPALYDSFVEQPAGQSAKQRVLFEKRIDGVPLYTVYELRR